NNFGGRLDLQQTRQVVEAALEAEINFLDTADIYGGGGSERFLGEILEGKRDEVVLATKFGMGPDEGMARGSREYMRHALASSLERLRTDYVDVYYYHQPDGTTPVDETTPALSQRLEQGRARAIVASNF